MSGINLEKEKKYKLSMKIKSTKTRKVNVVLQTGAPSYLGYGVNDVADLSEGIEYGFAKEFVVDKDTVTNGAINLGYQLGKFGDDECSNETIIFSEVCLQEVTE